MTKPKEIVVVAESIDLEDSSGSKANVALILNLKKAGFNISVFHYTRKKVKLEGIHCIAIKENRRSLLFFFSRIERQLRYKLNLNLNPIIEKRLGFSLALLNDRNSIASFLKSQLDFEPDLIITLSKGGSFRPHHALLKLPFLHQKWLAYIHDPYPMHLYPRPFAWVEPGYYKKWKFIKEISENAKYSAFPSKLLKEWMGSYFPNFLRTGIILPHQIFDFQAQVKDFPLFFKKENFNLLHAGTLLDQRNPNGLVEGFEIFLNRNPEAIKHSKLILIGGNEKFNSWLEDRKKKITGLELITSQLPFETVIAIQQLTTVNIILEAKSEISPFLPGKFPHCVQAGKPILLLGPYLSESRRLLGEDYPFWSEVDDPEKIAKLIQKLYLQWQENGALKLNKPQLQEYLSVSYLKETLKTLLEA